MQFSCFSLSSASVIPSRLVCSSPAKSNLEKKKKSFHPLIKIHLRIVAPVCFLASSHSVIHKCLTAEKLHQGCVWILSNHSPVSGPLLNEKRSSGQSWITTANICTDAEKLYHLKQKVEVNESLNKQHLLQIFNQFFKATHESKCKRKQCKVFTNTDLPRFL